MEKEIVIEDYMNMIHKEVNKVSKKLRNVEYQDIEGEAILLFYEALRKYNPDKGGFSTTFYFYLKQLFRKCYVLYASSFSGVVDPRTKEINFEAESFVNTFSDIVTHTSCEDEKCIDDILVDKKEEFTAVEKDDKVSFLLRVIEDVDKAYTENVSIIKNKINIGDIFKFLKEKYSFGDKDCNESITVLKEYAHSIV